MVPTRRERKRSDMYKPCPLVHRVCFSLCEGSSSFYPRMQMSAKAQRSQASSSMPLPSAWWQRPVSSQLRTPPTSGFTQRPHLRVEPKVFSQLQVLKQGHGGVSQNLQINFSESLARRYLAQHLFECQVLRLRFINSSPFFVFTLFPHPNQFSARDSSSASS